MTDLADPVVTAVYSCGCSFVDDTPLDGIVVPESTDEVGNVVPQRTLAKSVGYSFNADETEIFIKLEECKRRMQAGSLDKEDVVRFVEKILRRKLTAGQKARLDAATLPQIKARLAELLDAEPAPPRVLSAEGVTFPTIPSTCPRHGQTVVSTHASHLNPGAP